MSNLFKYTTLLLLLFTSSCSFDSGETSNTIYTSIYPIHEFTKLVVGDLYKVENITPLGVESHEYELTAKQLGRLEDSKAVFINGINMEYWSEQLPNKIKNKTYTVSEGIVIRMTNNQQDPHLWLNPLNAVKQMENIKNYMSSIDSSNASVYEANYLNAKEEYLALDEELKTIADTFSQKNIVVSHAAYGYMCDRYNLNQIAINGIEPDEEPTGKTVEAIIEAVNKYEIKAIFIEELISKDIAEYISNKCHVDIKTLSPIENIKDDESYISLMKENFKNLAEVCQ